MRATSCLTATACVRASERAALIARHGRFLEAAQRMEKMRSWGVGMQPRLPPTPTNERHSLTAIAYSSLATLREARSHSRKLPKHTHARDLCRRRRLFVWSQRAAPLGAQLIARARAQDQANSIP